MIVDNLPAPWQPLDTPRGRALTPGALGEAPPVSESTPGIMDSLRAFFQNENLIGSYAASESRRAPLTDDPSFNPWSLIEGTPREQHWERFADARNRAQFDAISHDIDREESNRKIMDATPLALSLPMGLAAGLLDPTILIPGGAFVRGAKGGVSVLRSAVNVGAAAGVATGLQEAGLHALQESRTGEESAWNIGASMLLGGLLGAGGAKLLSRAEWRKSVDDLQRGMDTAPADREGVPAPVGAAIGADVVKADLDALTIAGRAAGRTADATGWLNPGLRLAKSASAVARETAFNLFEMTQYLRGADEGIAAPRAVETLRKEWNAGLMKAVSTGRDAWLEYAKDKGGALYRAGVARAGPGRLSKAEFMSEVGRAMRRGDQHPIPEVAKAAAEWRKNVFNPLFEGAKEAGIWKDLGIENVSPQQAMSYFSRVYNREKIKAERPSVVRMLTDEYERDQATKAALKDKIKIANDELQDWSGRLAKMQARIARRDEKATALEGRLAERTMEADRTESRVGALEDRQASIAEEIEDLQAFIEDMRLAPARDPLFYARINELENSLSQLRKADKPITEADLRRMEKEEAKAALPPLMRRAAEIAVGRRRPPKVQPFLSWLIELGGVKDTGGDVKAILGSAKSRPGLIREEGMALDDIGVRIQEIAEGQFPRTDEPGGGAPDSAQILEWIDDASRGREPDWWVEARAKPEDLDVVKTAAALDEMMNRAGAEMKTVRDVADFLKGEGSGPVSLEDLDRIAADMEASGETIPVTFRRQEVEQELAIERSKIAEIRTAIQHGIARRDLLARRGTLNNQRVSEAGSAARINRGRVGVLEERIGANAERRDTLASIAEIIDRQRGVVRKEIEALLAEWNGKSTAEAKSAIKAREKYELEQETKLAQRTQGMGDEAGAQPNRLASADRTVDRTVRAILASDRDLSRGELQIEAEDTVERILHGGGSPENAAVRGGDDLRGPQLARVLNVRDELLEPWLESDIDMVGRRYHRIMSADVEIARKFGRIDMRDQIAAIRHDYSRLREGMPERSKERARLDKEEEGAVRDLEGIRDLLRGTYDMAAWERNFGNIVRVANMFNYIRSMGQVVLSSLPEAYRTAMVHGLRPFMETLGKINTDGFKASVREAKLAGNIGERALAHRLASLAEIGDFYTARGPVEKFMANMTEVASTWNGIRLWTDWARMVASTATQDRILSTASRYAKAGDRDRRYLAYLSIPEGMAGRIAKQFETFGETLDGVRVANTEKWTDPEAVRAYRAAVNKDIDTQVVTRSVADIPLFANTPMGRLLFQFNSFNLASHQRVLLRGLQEGPARFVSGAIALSTIGMAVTYLQSLAANRPVPSFAENPGWWIAEGLDRGGLINVPMQMANAFEKLTGVNPVKVPLKLFDEGDAQSFRLNNRNMSSLLGPSMSAVEDIASVLGIPASVASGKDVSQAQKNAWERLLPFNSYLGLRQMLRYVVNPPD